MADSKDRDTLTAGGGSLTPERFAQVRAIFEAAIDRPAAERRAYAAGACAGDPTLLREVEAMLSAENNDNGPLDRKPSSTSSAPEEGRFPAGTVLAGRYRTLGLLGHGGMGEVYKAFDLILNQLVALKFLSPRHIGEAALVRFRNEVRTARQVSHPNVCRVYDLGMIEGLHFLSMEYIDGEDLASLLRRIGRLPQDKAIEFTRKICAGLSAAHERGVLHRDLKPANIMIDGRGQPRITDFGLAALAQEIPLSDLKSGTPAYMSPEQKAGKEVTTRSDIYSLGLVLHEMFTGKPRKDTQSSPSDIVKDLDPALDRLILRCLEEDPKRRPNSALNVAMALPGADPIAAALAAGETPSPEMVAASTGKEGFQVRTAWICFGAAVAAFAGAIILAESTGFLSRAPLPLPPDALADRAQELLRAVGYAEEPNSKAYGFYCCDDRAARNLDRYDAARRKEILASHQPPILAFFYRQTMTVDSVNNGFPDGSSTTRAVEDSNIRVILNAKGTLIHLEAPATAARDHKRASEEIDWSKLFASAGLDLARFRSATPETLPPSFADHRQAWTGNYGDNRNEQVRVEAASWQGQPVLFDVQPFPPAKTPGADPALAVAVFVLLLAIITGVFTAWRNLKQGRSDRRGALAIAGASLLLGIVVTALAPSHWRDPASWSVRDGFTNALVVAVGLWIAYIAVEPYARRNWPDSLISWTRFVSGKIRNPLVASHILAGVVAAQVFSFAYPATHMLLGAVPERAVAFGAYGFGSAAHATAVWLEGAGAGIAGGCILLLLVVVLRLILRKVWIADVVAALVAAYSVASIYPLPWQTAVSVAFAAISMLAYVWVIRRFGFLSMIVMWIFVDTRLAWPVTLMSWLAGRSITLNLIPLAIAGWAVWVIVSSQRSASSESAV